MIEAIATELLGLWRHPLAASNQEDQNSPDCEANKLRILREKPLLWEVYRQWFGEYSPAIHDTETLRAFPMIEIGSGNGLVRHYHPDIIPTELEPNSHVETIAHSSQLPFGNDSLRAIFLTNVLHHMENPADFFSEAQRCLVNGGRLVMVEPANSWLTRNVLARFHPFENYDGKAESWVTKTSGRLTGANIAIPWIIFFRDRQIFSQTFPSLKILEVRRHTFFNHFLTGGFQFRSFIPSQITKICLWFEELLRKLIPKSSVMMTITLEKTSSLQQ